MNMPTICDDCEFCERAISGYDWCCIPMVKGRSKPLDEPVTKPDWCPLVPVPDHGDLIDRGVILNEAVAISGPMTGDGWDNWGVYGLIQRQPTIIPAEKEV